MFLWKFYSVSFYNSCIISQKVFVHIQNVIKMTFRYVLMLALFYIYF